MLSGTHQARVEPGANQAQTGQPVCDLWTSTRSLPCVTSRPTAARATDGGCRASPQRRSGTAPESPAARLAQRGGGGQSR
jgi:hypothetical protein